MGDIMSIATTNNQPDWAAIAEMSAEERTATLAAFGYNDCGFETHDNAIGDLVAWAVHVAQAAKVRDGARVG